MSTHALVVGGTGMLKAVTLSLAEQFDTVSVIARSTHSIVALQNSSSVIHGLSVDYTNPVSLKEMLDQAVSKHGAFDLIVAWIHDTAPNAPLEIARYAKKDARYIHVLSSEIMNPSSSERSLRMLFETLSVLYEEVVLGFIREGNASRWLRNDEIAAGVLRAIHSPMKRVIIGTVEPWSMRP